jgi:hypothetical protein
LNSSRNIIRTIKSRGMRWAEHVACMGEMRNEYKIFTGMPGGKRPLRTCTRRWEYHIKRVSEKLNRRIWTGFI